MAIFGLGSKAAKPVATVDKKQDKSVKKQAAASGNQADEAKAILEKMEAKKDAGDCAFC